ncbi:MAG: arsenate reductase ArsC [Pseudomonadota bacterium]
MQKKFKILFVCTHNACRSQMAEGWANHLGGTLVEAHSAGTVRCAAICAESVEVMMEAGVDISKNKPKLVDEYDLNDFDLIVTVCDHANETCPNLPKGVKHIHQNFVDPGVISKGAKDREEILDYFRKSRDEIKEFIRKLLSNRNN